MKPYVIKQGDYLLKIAHLLGFDADEVWADAKNAELKKTRKDPSMLVAGDVLFVPDEPKKKLKLNFKETNVYVARVPSVKVSLVVAGDSGPMKNEKYVVEGLGDDATEHTTDGDGKVEFEAPVHLREALVRFVKSGMKLHVAIGDLDPPETPSGARMRLTSLGFYASKLSGADPYVAHDEKALAAAVKAFQSANALDPSGIIDAATRAALVAAHGS